MAKLKSEEFNERMRARLTPRQNGAEVVQRLKESARRRRERRI